MEIIVGILLVVLGGMVIHSALKDNTKKKGSGNAVIIGLVMIREFGIKNLQ